MTFKDDYTTQARITENPEKEEGKIILTDVEYLNADLMEKLTNQLRRIANG